MTQFLEGRTPPFDKRGGWEGGEGGSDYVTTTFNLKKNTAIAFKKIEKNVTETIAFIAIISDTNIAT